MNYILVILLLASQFVIFPGLSFRWCKEISVQVLIITLICSLIWKRNKPIALFVGWSLFLFFLFKSYSINDFGGTSRYQINLFAFFNIINIVLYGLFYYVLHQIKLNRKLIYKTFCFIAIFQAVFIILQKYQFGQFFMNNSAWITDLATRRKISWPVAMWGNETLASWSLAICSPFFLAFKRFRFKLGYAMTLFATWCTGGRAALIAAILGFVFWLFFTKRRLAVLIILALLMGGCLLFQHGKLDTYDPHRIAVWKETIRIWHDKHITGWGLGSFRHTFYRMAPQFARDGHWTQTHNDWLQLLFEQGIVGLGIILSLVWITLYNFWKKRKGLIPITSLFIFSMVAFWGFPMHTSLGILLIVSLVMFEQELYE